MKRITKIKWLKISLIISIVMICLYAIAQDEPSGYTSWFRLRMWEEGDHPGADSVNQNLIDIDLHLHNRDKRIDSLKGAYTNMFNFPAGTWKKYDSTVFDNDTMKFKIGVVPLLSADNSFSGNNIFTSGEVKFDASGPGGTNLNFVYDNDLGGVFIKKNTSTTLLEFNEIDGLYWQFKYPVTVNGNVDITGNYMVNGVPISSGGGDAYLTNRQTFTKRNVFSDTLKADGLSLIDNARITSNLNVTGDVISDLNFLKGSSTSIGTISTDSLAIITNNTKRIVIRPTGQAYFFKAANFTDSLNVTGAILKADSINLSKDLNMLSDTSGIIWKSGGLSEIYQIQSPAQILAFKQNEFDFFTKKNTQLMYLDSLNGMTLNYGIYTGNGSGLTSVNAITLKGQDTTHFARTDTSTTENIKGVWNFWDIVSFITIPTIPSFFQNAARTIQYYLPNSASDTLLTRNQTQTVTNKTISGSSNTITNLPRGIMTLWNSNLAAPLDATTYYGAGCSGETPTVTESVMRTYIPTGCTIKSVSCYAWVGPTTPNPTGQAITVSIGINGSYTQLSDAWLWDTPSSYNAVTTTGLSIAVTSGQYITMKILTPTWVTTNPVNVRLMFTIYFE